MNATEQRTHRTVTEELHARIETLETLVTQMSRNCDYLKRMSDEHHNQLLNHAYMMRSFRSRLGWLFLGR